MIVSKYFEIDGKNYVEAADYDKVLYELHYANEKIDELKSELSVKENLLKIKNGLCENENADGLLFPSEPISVAEQLINATYTREKGDMEKVIHKAFGYNSDTVTENVYSVSELRQIAEHLLVYCEHNSDNAKD